MKILKDNYSAKTDYPKVRICDNCLSEIEYEKVDIRIGFLGLAYLDCPLCGHDNTLEDDEDYVTLTVDNVEFPTHFYHTSVETGAFDYCNNTEIKKYISEAINFFREHKEEYNWCCQSGNLYVHVRRWAGDEVYEVVVSNNYYSTEIPFEEIDKEMCDK